MLPLRRWRLRWLAAGGGGVGSAAETPSQAAGSTTRGLPAALRQPAPPAEDHARGLNYAGLRRTSVSEACRGRFEFRLATGETGCTHGPDPAPEGIDVRTPVAVPKVSAEAVAALASTLTCHGDGTSGNRIQLVYARAKKARLLRPGFPS